jgi:hypothetical protein
MARTSRPSAAERGLDRVVTNLAKSFGQGSVCRAGARYCFELAYAGDRGRLVMAAKTGRLGAAATARKALLQALVDEIRVDSRDEIYAFFTLPAVRAPYGSMHPASHNPNHTAGLPGPRFELTVRYGRKRDPPLR